MTQNRCDLKWSRFFSVLFGLLLGGFMWRCRGESGFGSSWGLYSVGLVLTLLIYFFYGKAYKLSFEKITLGALITGLGVTGYGTLVAQPAGILYSDVPYNGAENFAASVEPKSGLLMFLIMSCTFIPFFSFFVFSLFSEKEYKIKEFITVILVFFIVSYIFKATLAHPILKLINPDQVNYAMLGLKHNGLDYKTPFEAYMKHFAQRNWCEKTPFFENYYMSIEQISDLFGVISIAVYAALFKKDRKVGIYMLVLSFLNGLFSALSSFCVSAHYGTGLYENTPILVKISQWGGWGLWEYCTGAFLGLFTMLTVAFFTLKNPPEEEKTDSLIDNKSVRYGYNILSSLFIFAVVPGRALGIRVAKLLKYEGVIEHSGTLETVLTIVAALAIGIFILIKLLKNRTGDHPLGVDTERFTLTALPAYFLFCVPVYFFLNRADLLHIPFSEMSSPLDFFRTMASPEFSLATVMLITFILVLVLTLCFRKYEKAAVVHTESKK